MRARLTHKDVLGTFPKDDERPTNDQLSALAAWLRATPNGRRKAPYVNFGLWTAHADVLMEKSVFAPRILCEDGSWAPRRFEGPATFHDWKVCWRVFEVAMISLKAASPAHLQDYRDGIELLAGRYPTRWGHIAEVENHLRWSQWDRMLEEGIHDGTRTQDAGWSQIISDSAFYNAYRGQLAGWWDKNLTWSFDHPNRPIVEAAPPTQALQQRLAALERAVAHPKKQAAVPKAPKAPKQATPKTPLTCWNCGGEGHPYWRCTELTGRALSAELQQKGTGKGKGGGKGKGEKGDAAQAPAEGTETPPAGAGGKGRRRGGRNVR